MNKITDPASAVTKVPEVIWTGDQPDLRISGPGLPTQPIPATWLTQ
jgi:hypothetical protein